MLCSLHACVWVPVVGLAAGLLWGTVDVCLMCVSVCLVPYCRPDAGLCFCERPVTSNQL